MQVLLLALAFLGLSDSAVYRQPARKIHSLRAKMIKDGTYVAFLAQQHLARAQGGALGGSKAGVVSQPFVDYLDDLFVGEVALGSPLQNFTVILNTASADLWVVDSACDTPACKGLGGYEKQRFDKGASSTYHNASEIFLAWEHGSGRVTAKGWVATDVLNLAGLVYNSQHFAIAFDVSDNFGKQPADGTLGLGWPALADIDHSPPIQNLLDQLDLPLFTMWLDAKPKEAGRDGLITYGALDAEHCAEQVDYVALSSRMYWMFPLNAFSIGTYSTVTKTQAGTDSSISWFGAPVAAISGIVEATGAKFDSLRELYILPCNGAYPDMFFTIGGRQYVIPSSEYVIDVGLARGRCVLGVFEMWGNSYRPDWVFGNIWLRVHCNVHDVGQKRIGFATVRHSENATITDSA